MNYSTQKMYVNKSITFYSKWSRKMVVPEDQLETQLGGDNLKLGHKH